MEMGSSDQNALLGQLIFTLIRQLFGNKAHVHHVSNHSTVVLMSCLKLDQSKKNYLN